MSRLKQLIDDVIYSGNNEHDPELVNLVSAAKRSHKGSKIGGAAKTPKDIVFDESSVS